MKNLFCLFLTGCASFFLLTGCEDKEPEEKAAETVESSTDTTSTEDLSSSLPEEEKTFVSTPSSTIEWSGSRPSGEITGGFGNFVGKFEIAGGELVPKGRHFVTIDMASVRTDSDEFTASLKSPRFFDVKQYPIARFQLMTAVPVEGEEDRYDITGVLDMHGVAQRISFPATMKIGGRGNLLDLAAEFPINRKDYGLNHPGSPDDEIDDEISLKFSINAIPGEPKELVLMDVTEASGPDGRGPGMKGKGFGGGKGKGFGGKGRGDWRNMSEEERAERRRQFMAEIDKNGDGNIGKDEVPERAWQFFGRADSNGDDMVSAEERTEFRAKMEAERELRELSGEGGFGGRPGGFRGGDDRGGDRGPKGGN